MAYNIDKDKTLTEKELAWNGTNKIVMKLVQYAKGEVKVQIQEYYTKNQGKTFHPGKALHRMPLESARLMAENLAKYVEEFDPTIDSEGQLPSHKC